jgi:transcriptional regulator with XRE-family HTH domain
MPEPNTTQGADGGIGRRIARKRRARGLTQQGLADRAFVSLSLVQQVETGKKPASPSLVAAAAAAMHVDPAELYGQPYRRVERGAERVHTSVDDVRRALAYSDVPPDLDAPPRSLETLAAEITSMQRLLRQSRPVQVGVRIPAVIIELAAHAHETESPRAWRLLNRAIAIAVSFARRLGYNDLASLGIEHAVRAAAKSDDPNLLVLADHSRSMVYLTMGAWTPGLKLVRATAAQIDRDTPVTQAIYGAFHLRAAIICARAGMTSDAWEHHGIAADVAEEIPGRTPDPYGLQFSRANAAIHGAAVAVELTDYDEAIRRDELLTLPRGVSAERRAHHDIDMGRALVSTGRWDATLRRILQAEHAAPQMTRYHPMARESVGHLVDHHRVLPEPLRALHERMGLA